MSEFIIKAADWAIDYNGESLFKGCEEIVRCRDCIYSVNDAMYCTEGCYDESEYRNVEPDGFCKWSEGRSK